MEDNTDITGAVYELFTNAEKMYGDAIKNYWFYESETCPCCGKIKIDTLNMVEKLALSLSAFMYRDMSTLIAYLLCSHCIAELLRKSKRYKIMYKDLEETLKNAYTEHLKSTSS